MDFILEFLAIFIFFLVLSLVVGLIAYLVAKKKKGVFKNYALQHFPDLKDQELLIAKQTSKKAKLDIALIINDAKEELVLLLDVPGKGIIHKVYSFQNLKVVETFNTILERGFAPKTYSYEQTLALKLDDGSTYRFIMENISNKRGSDKGADVVRNTFAPWEEKLNKIANK